MVGRGRPNAFATARRLSPAVRFSGGAGALQHRKVGLAFAAARLLGGVLGDLARDLAQRIGAEFHTREYARNTSRPFPGECFGPIPGTTGRAARLVIGGPAEVGFVGKR